MTLPTHALLGLSIGHITHHPLIGLFFSVIPDIDHLYSYIKHRYYRDWSIFYKNAFGKEDLYGDQRNILHNVVVFGFFSLIFFIFIPSIAPTVSLAYFSHILLDSLDSSLYYPLYPIKKYSIRGPIEFYSKSELLIFTILLAFVFYIYFVK